MHSIGIYNALDSNTMLPCDMLPSRADHNAPVSVTTHSTRHNVLSIYYLQCTSVGQNALVPDTHKENKKVIPGYTILRTKKVISDHDNFENKKVIPGHTILRTEG